MKNERRDGRSSNGSRNFPKENRRDPQSNRDAQLDARARNRGRGKGEPSQPPVTGLSERLGYVADQRLVGMTLSEITKFIAKEKTGSENTLVGELRRRADAGSLSASDETTSAIRRVLGKD